MPITLSGTTGITTPAIADTGTLSVTGVTTLTGGLNAALPVLSGGTGVTTSTGTGANVLGTSPTLATPTFDSAQLPTISGTAPLYMCRAWVNFNGTGTVAIRASGNVSSITDRGVGRYTVNFTTAMVDVNYSTSTGVRKLDTNEDNNMVITLGATNTAYSTTAVALTTGFATSGSNQDAELACVAVFR
jgi:hypothetical protein